MRRRGRPMKLSHMKLRLSLCASLMGLGVIPSSSSVAQSGWFWQNPLPQGNPLWAVSVFDSDNATVVGASGTILRTTDGGATWMAQTSGTTNNLRGVSFVDANTGTAVGAGETILRTTDGGATWTRQAGTRQAYDLNGVSFVDANIGTAVGGYSSMHAQIRTIIRTTDGGATWILQSSQ